MCVCVCLGGGLGGWFAVSGGGLWMQWSLRPSTHLTPPPLAHPPPWRVARAECQKRRKGGARRKRREYESFWWAMRHTSFLRLVVLVSTRAFSMHIISPGNSLPSSAHTLTSRSSLPRPPARPPALAPSTQRGGDGWWVWTGVDQGGKERAMRALAMCGHLLHTAWTCLDRVYVALVCLPASCACPPRCSEQAASLH